MVFYPLRVSWSDAGVYLRCHLFNGKDLFITLNEIGILPKGSLMKSLGQAFQAISTPCFNITISILVRVITSNSQVSETT